MEELKKELTEEQAAGTAGGFANMPNPFADNGFANMPNPFANPVTTNGVMYDGEGHSQGETWMNGSMMMYIVKSGDSLFQISNDHGVKLGDVKALNPQITNPQWIHPGDVLRLK